MTWRTAWDGLSRLAEVEHPSGDGLTNDDYGKELQVFQDDGVQQTRYVHDRNKVL